MTKLWLLIAWTLGWLLLPTLAMAQDPCAVPEQGSVQVRRNDQVRFAWCHELIDDVNDPIQPGTIRFRLMSVDANNAPTGTLVDFGTPQPVSGPWAGNKYYYEGTNAVSFAQDNRIAVTAEYNGVFSLPSTPVVVDVRGGPKTPSGLRVVISQP